MMSEELDLLAKKYKTRSAVEYYFLSFIVGVIVIIVLLAIFAEPIGGLTKFGRVFLTAPLASFGLAIVLFILFHMIKDSAKAKFRNKLNEQIVDWKKKAVVNTILSIESSASVPIANIETYAQSLLNQRLIEAFPRIDLIILKLFFPETVYILQQVLAEDSSLGTYYEVEQFFCEKNLKTLQFVS